VSPVVLLVYRRPEQTRAVLAAIAAAAPRRLYVFGDGARNPQEGAAVRAVREVVDAGITWDCEVELEFAETNLGCRGRVVSALDSVFTRESRAVILEDDCLPVPDFFPFCDELLERYAEDRRVMAINGFNPQPRSMPDSYFFSCHSVPWGWATWRRAWEAYDRDLRTLDQAVDSAWPLTSQGGPGASYLRQALREVRSGSLDTWDFQWMFSVWIQGGVVVRPAANLIRNVGFGSDAVHTTDALHLLAEARATSLTWPLAHPQWISRDYEHDLRLPLLLFPWLESGPRRLLAAIRRRVASLMGRLGW
jgi:hypothetical protein